MLRNSCEIKPDQFTESLSIFNKVWEANPKSSQMFCPMISYKPSLLSYLNSNVKALTKMSINLWKWHAYK